MEYELTIPYECSIQHDLDLMVETFGNECLQEYQSIVNATSLPKISPEEKHRQSLMIDAIDTECRNRKQFKLIRSMGNVAISKASFYAMEFTGSFKCSCNHSHCDSNIQFHSPTEYTIVSVCQYGGDDGVAVMQNLNLKGFGLVSN